MLFFKSCFIFDILWTQKESLKKMQIKNCMVIKFIIILQFHAKITLGNIN